MALIGGQLHQAGYFSRGKRSTDTAGVQFDQEDAP